MTASGQHVELSINELDQLFSHLYAFRKTALLLNHAQHDSTAIAELGLNNKQLAAIEKSPDLMVHIRVDYNIWPTIPKEAYGQVRLLEPLTYLKSMAQRQSLLQRWWNRFFIAHIKEGDIVFDIGGGVGYLALMMARVADQVYVYDRPEMVELAMKSWIDKPSNIHFTGCDINEWPLQSKEKCTFVFIGEVLHGKTYVECVRILAAVRSSLKSGGRIIVADLEKNTVLSRFFDTQMKIHTNKGRLYYKSELVIMLKAAGFDKVTGDIKDVTPYHFAISGVKT